MNIRIGMNGEDERGFRVAHGELRDGFAKLAQAGSEILAPMGCDENNMIGVLNGADFKSTGKAGERVHARPPDLVSRPQHGIDAGITGYINASRDRAFL